MAFLAGLLNLPVFVPPNLAVLLECRCRCRRSCSCRCMCVCADDTIPPPACPSVQVRSSTRLWLTVHQLLFIRFLILYVCTTVQGVECRAHSTGPPPVTLMQHFTRNTTIQPIPGNKTSGLLILQPWIVDLY